MLDEVVVTALGIKREQKALGYAVQEVKSDQLTVAKGANVATSLTGKIAGLNIKNSTEFAAAPTLTLRGSTPLLVVDGPIIIMSPCLIYRQMILNPSVS